MLELGYGGAVECSLQAIFVHLSAAHLAQGPGLEQAYAPSFKC
jgi:hypothetical protein